MKLIPKNWVKFQHYKDRNPPWIKLHRDLLIDKEFMRLPLASKALAPMLWLLASESVSGEFEADTEQLEFRLRLSPKEINDGLKPLIDNGFFLDASTMLAPCLQDAIPETETEAEKETEIYVEILNYLNKKAGKNYRPVKANLDLIKARIDEGYTKDDIIKVIDSKCSTWLSDSKMKVYLRPETLFNRTKLAQYTGEDNSKQKAWYETGDTL